MKDNNLSIKNQLDEWQLERLCILVYLDVVLQKSSETNLSEIIKDFKSNELQEPLPCLMLPQEWLNVLDSIQKDPELCELKIYEYEDIRENEEDVLKGHRSVCFIDVHKNAYIIFRGTSGDEEWADNGNTMLQSDTIQQKAALRFVKKIIKTLKPKTITVAGHSKGGNKAQYVAITAPENYTVNCVSVDGPGFSPEFIAKYNDKILKNKNILLLAEQRDYVNCLGFNIGQTKYYRGFRSESSQFGQYGYPIKYFHCPNSLRDKNGNILKSIGNSVISDVINQLTEYFLTNDLYKIEKEAVTSHILTLLMTEAHCSNEDLGHAVARITTLIFDMISNLKGFSEKIHRLIFEEADMLVATIEEVFSPKVYMSNQKSLKECIIEELLLCIFETPASFRNFIKASGALVGMSAKMMISVLHNKIILNYIIKAISSIIEHIAKKQKVNSSLSNLHHLLETLANRMGDKQSDLFQVNEPIESIVDSINKEFNDLLKNLEDFEACVDNDTNSTETVYLQKVIDNKIQIDIKKRESPNMTKKRSGYKPDMIACHITEGSFAGAVSWLCNPLSQASAHFIVSKKGEIVQLVDIEDTAWCNGTSNDKNNSRYYGKSKSKLVRERKVNANLYTISIEHEGKVSEKNGDLTPEQKMATIKLIKFIKAEVKRIYNINILIDKEHILGHCEITPEWKPNCPGKKYPFTDIIKQLQND